MFIHLVLPCWIDAYGWHHHFSMFIHPFFHEWCIHLGICTYMLTLLCMIMIPCICICIGGVYIYYCIIFGTLLHLTHSFFNCVEPCYQDDLDQFVYTMLLIRQFSSWHSGEEMESWTGKYSADSDQFKDLDEDLHGNEIIYLWKDITVACCIMLNLAALPTQ